MLGKNLKVVQNRGLYKITTKNGNVRKIYILLCNFYKNGGFENG